MVNRHVVTGPNIRSGEKNDAEKKNWNEFVDDTTASNGTRLIRDHIASRCPQLWNSSIGNSIRRITHVHIFHSGTLFVFTSLFDCLTHSTDSQRTLHGMNYYYYYYLSVFWYIPTTQLNSVGGRGTSRPQKYGSVNFVNLPALISVSIATLRDVVHHILRQQASVPSKSFGNF